MNTPSATAEPDPGQIRHHTLERIAHAALQVGAMLTQSGASVSTAHEAARMIVAGFGVEVLGLRSGYTSLEITVGDRPRHHHPDDQHRSARREPPAGFRGARPGGAGLAAAACRRRRSRPNWPGCRRDTPRHPPWLVAIATGAACAAFGRLLGADWPAFLPMLAAAGIGQAIRHWLIGRQVNVFVIAAIIGCVAATLGGLGARLAGSHTIELAMMASILLLVPGVPSTNAQTDIMDGYPTMGSARAVWVIMVMVFAVTGLWVAEFLLRMPT